MTETPSRLFDVVGYATGTPGAGEQLAIAVRFLLRDGTSMDFAIPAEIAAGLAIEITGILRTLAGRAPPASH